MTGINTFSALGFLKKYDGNQDGLSRQELMNGTLNSYSQILNDLTYGNRNLQNVMDTFQELMFAFNALDNFDAYSNASGQFLRNDNPNTISPFDLLKVASNDGNLYDLSQNDTYSQQRQSLSSSHPNWYPSSPQQPINQQPGPFAYQPPQAMGQPDNYAAAIASSGNNNAFAAAVAGSGNNMSAAIAYADQNNAFAAAIANNNQMQQPVNYQQSQQQTQPQPQYTQAIPQQTNRPNNATPHSTYLPQVSGQTIIGNDTEEKINGTKDDDLLMGRGGNDKINGKDGNDLIFGGAGDDKLKGGNGNDLIKGQAGNDKIYGGKGDDVLFGGSGDDIIKGEKGNDVLFGGLGNDELDGGKGDDVLIGGRGDDKLNGGKGNDLLIDGKGNDTIKAGKGDDTIIINSADNHQTTQKIDAGKGDDTITINPQDGELNEYNIKTGGGKDSVELNIDGQYRTERPGWWARTFGGQPEYRVIDSQGNVYNLEDFNLKKDNLIINGQIVNL